MNACMVSETNSENNIQLWKLSSTNLLKLNICGGFPKIGNMNRRANFCFYLYLYAKNNMLLSTKQILQKSYVSR